MTIAVCPSSYQLFTLLFFLRELNSLFLGDSYKILQELCIHILSHVTSDIFSRQNVLSPPVVRLAVALGTCVDMMYANFEQKL